MLRMGLRRHGEHADAPPLRSPRNGSSPIATSLAWWIASERSATLEGEPVDLHGPFEGRRTRSCLGRRGLPRVSRADQVGAAVLFEAMPILGWRVHFTRRQLMMPRTARPTLLSLNGDGVADWLDSHGRVGLVAALARVVLGGVGEWFRAGQGRYVSSSSTTRTRRTPGAFCVLGLAVDPGWTSGAFAVAHTSRPSRSTSIH